MIAWSTMPSGIPSVRFPPYNVWIPLNVAAAKRKRNAEPQFLMVDTKPAMPQEIKLEIVGFGSP